MELFEQDTYRCEVSESIDHSVMSELFLLYQPLLGADAIALYATLLIEVKANAQALSHYRLCKLLTYDIDQIERARIKLEQYNLLKTFYHKQKEEYIYHLQRPLTASDFLRHYVYGVQYKKAMGLNDYETTKEMIAEQSFDHQDYQEITTRFDQQSLQKITSKDVEEFIAVKAKDIKSDLNMGYPKGFDYQGFIKNLSELAFPRKLRTSENMRLIAQLSIIYGIGVDRMRVLACRSIDIKQQAFDATGLINRARKEQPSFDISQVDSYDLPPMVFLQRKQPNMPVSLSSKKTLEYLVNDTPLATQVVNYLIEYVLDNTNNTLNQKYVEKIAETFVRSSVKTLEDAKDLIKKMGKQTKEKDMRNSRIDQASVEVKRPTNEDKENIDVLKKQIKEKVERMK